jgi:hypothetical protein
LPRTPSRWWVMRNKITIGMVVVVVEAVQATNMIGDHSNTGRCDWAKEAARAQKGQDVEKGCMPAVPVHMP